ncbi:DUF3795 domain-containing protein [bacterium]|nr:DUF3795 domain-containing protein [bacterium]RQV98958.1 MAG: DUF3795 domain-containing protein [bacterium]
MVKQSKYGPCGLYCGACGVTDCGGCQSDRIDDYVRNCTFRRCSQEKHLDFCCFCNDFPCEELNTFMHDKWPHHWTMEPNLQFIKMEGFSAWLQKQEKEWSCQNCGSEITWYQQKCECGRTLDAWEVPE